MDNLARIIHELKAINADLEAYNNKEMAILGSSLKEKYIGCIYCGEEKGDKLSCCGENHFDELEDE